MPPLTTGSENPLVAPSAVDLSAVSIWSAVVDGVTAASSSVEIAAVMLGLTSFNSSSVTGAKRLFFGI